MKIKSQRDFVSGLMFLVVGVAFAIGATEYAYGTSARPGPGYFPLLLGVLLALLGAIVTFTSLTIEREGGDPIGHIALRPMSIIVGSVVIFGFALPRLGMAVTLPLLVIISSLASDEFSWRGTLINALVLTVVSWAVFIKGLGLIIPLWPTFLAPAA